MILIIFVVFKKDNYKLKRESWCSEKDLHFINEDLF
jgi:hypothetical protein